MAMKKVIIILIIGIIVLSGCSLAEAAPTDSHQMSVPSSAPEISQVISSSSLSETPSISSSSLPETPSIPSRTISSAPQSSQSTVSSSVSEETYAEPDQQGLQIYYTATGEKYHYENPCGNGTYYPCTLEEALNMGLEPCGKCVLDTQSLPATQTPPAPPVIADPPPPAPPAIADPPPPPQEVYQEPEPQPQSPQVYYTATGAKYHYLNPCGNGTYYPCTLEEALSMGLGPCGKCVL